MPLEDLDLVFEDEEDQKKKKSEVVHTDLDLEFGATASVKPQSSASAKPQSAPASAPVRAAPAAAPAAVEAPSEDAEPGSASVKRIEEVRAKMAAAKATPAPVAAVPAAASVGHTSTAIRGAAALKLANETEIDPVAEMARQLEETKIEARVQLAVMQEKVEFITDVMSDAKLLQHQMTQLLTRMNQKHPDLKPELLAVQKLLADFIAKKRK